MTKTERDIRHRLNEHRQKAMICCEPNCWCWDVDNLLSALDALQARLEPVVEVWEKYKDVCVMLTDNDACYLFAIKTWNAISKAAKEEK